MCRHRGVNTCPQVPIFQQELRTSHEQRPEGHFVKDNSEKGHAGNERSA